MKQLNIENWKGQYQDKMISCEEAVGKISSGDKIFAGCNHNIAYHLLDLLADRRELEDVELSGSLLLHPSRLLEDASLRGKITYTTHFLSGSDAKYYKNGNVRINSVHLGSLSKYATQVLKTNVLMTECSEPDDEGYLYFGISGVVASWDVARQADKIILCVNKYQRQPKGIDHRIHVSQVDWLCERHTPLPEFPQPEPTPAELAIAQHILPNIPDGATLQLGIGGLPNAVGFGLENRKNLSVWSEMYTDSLLYLAKKGVITGRQVASFCCGKQEVYDYIGAGNVEMAPMSLVNNAYEIGKNDSLISINGALMVDLTGQACSESLGFRQYSCTGGQLDFVRGAALSKNGKSFLCLASTFEDKSGKVESRIKLTLPAGAVVTTPRSDVMYIVTEYGIADLYLRPVEERVNSLIAIAHPDFRAELREGAIREGLIRG
jgi:acyl-CoA hydrolase